jgi:hypothetical protein
MGVNEDQLLAGAQAGGARPTEALGRDPSNVRKVADELVSAGALEHVNPPPRAATGGARPSAKTGLRLRRAEFRGARWLRVDAYQGLSERNASLSRPHAVRLPPLVGHFGE